MASMVPNPQLGGPQPPQLPPQRPAPNFNNLGPSVQRLFMQMHQLRQAGHTESTSPELASIVSRIKALSKARQQQGMVPASGVPPADVPVVPQAPNGVPEAPKAAEAGALLPAPTSTLPPNTPAAPTPVTFTGSQLHALRAQIQAFRLLSRGQSVPLAVQQAIHVQELEDKKPSISSTTTTSVSTATTDAATKTSSPNQPSETKTDTPSQPTLVFPDGRILEQDKSSPIYPYNAYTPPLVLVRKLIKGSPALAVKRKRVIMPSVMPTGIDPYKIVAEHNRVVDARIAQRIRELSAVPGSIGDGGLHAPIGSPTSDKENYVMPHTQAKLKALIELKALKLREKQRALRATITQRLADASALTMDRKEFRRVRKPTPRDAKNTELLEKKQRQDRERRVKQKHLDYLNMICDHGRELITRNRTNQARAQRLAKSVLNFHVQTEKEEQKRIERISKERLKALKADDEVAYMKLLDTAKDTRITQLLRQTDSYLDSLAQAVVVQQNEDVHRDIGLPFETEDHPTDETTFGATRMVDENEENKPKVDYYSVAHRISEKVTAQPKLLAGGTLKEYQIKGLQWMVSLYNNRLNGILADEMGLGKTIQTISLITFLIERKRQIGPYLVIAPLSTLTNWSLEFRKWAPAVGLLVYKGGPAVRKQLAQQIRQDGFQVLLTTYEYIIMDKAVLGRIKWVHMIIDEGHRMKNTRSKLSLTLTQHYSSRFRLILTGTPLQNKLPELWALLNFVLPKIFNSVQSFDEWFATPFANTGAADKIEPNEEESLLIIKRLHKVLRPFLLRRLKKDVESELPDKVEKVIKCKMSGLQYQLYQQMKKHGMLFDERVNEKGKQMGIKGLNNVIMQFRKICQHPYVFNEVEDMVNPTHAVDVNIIRAAGKVSLLDRLLPKLFATNHRVLIFFQMTNVMDIMGDYFKFRNIPFLRLDGSTKPDDRATLLQEFNAPGCPVAVFMLSTRAGGLGLNLQTADTVIIYDSDWNPHADLQAQDRAHRIGQKNSVRILRFVTEKSIEEVMLARAKSKLDMDGKVIQAGKFDNKSTAEEQERYLRSLLDADNDEETDESACMEDDEINEIIARTDEELEIFRRMDIDREDQEQREWEAEGGRGPKPDRLMQVHELPEVYQRDEPFHPPETEDEILLGRARRVKNKPKYTDGMTDEQWLQAVDAGEDPEEFYRQDDDSDPSLPSSPSSIVEPPRKGRPQKGKAKKGRPPKIIDDVPMSPGPGSKRKRGGQSTSVTPSIIDDDDDPRGQKRRKTGLPVAAMATRMRKVFQECYNAVDATKDEGGHDRAELFRQLPNKKEYPAYYTTIPQPISMSQIKKKFQSNLYKSVIEFRDDWRLMFGNARIFNQEGSYVYIQAEEMQKVLERTFNKLTAGTDMPGAEVSGGPSSPTADDDEVPISSGRKSRAKAIPDDDDFTEPDEDSDDD